MGTLLNRQSDLALVGAVPADLDGLWLLPSESEGGDVRLHALRVGAGRSLWYASVAELPGARERWAERLLPLARPATVGPGAWSRVLSWDLDALSVHARRGAETHLTWSLRAGAEQRDGGLLGVESAREIADLFVTESSLVLISVSGDERNARYQVGIAPRRERARVQWLAAEQEGWPELLHARESADLIQVELAVRATRFDASARVVRWTIDTRALLAAVQALLDFALAWPSVLAEQHPSRVYLCGVSGERAHGDPSPALVKLDLQSGGMEMRSFGFARELGAPALAQGSGTEPRLFVLLPVYDAVRDRTDCYTLDADALDATPCAIIRLPPVRATQRTHWIDSQRFRALDTALGTIVRAIR
ncbi:MAG TPA: hypothetical protein VI299_06110 [Polyangiales bacterium]